MEPGVGGGGIGGTRSWLDVAMSKERWPGLLC